MYFDNFLVLGPNAKFRQPNLQLTIMLNEIILRFLRFKKDLLFHLDPKVKYT